MTTFPRAIQHLRRSIDGLTDAANEARARSPKDQHTIDALFETDARIAEYEAAIEKLGAL